MKRPIFYILVLLVVSCTTKNPEKKTVAHNEEVTTTITNENLSHISFAVEGMTCEVGCAARIEKKVAAMEGVAVSKVDFEAKTASVSFDSTLISFDDMRATIEALGDDYKVGDATAIPALKLKSSGKKCDASCKKECCSKKKKCDKTCEKACCKKEGKKDKKACDASCKKECCAKKKESH